MNLQMESLARLCEGLAHKLNNQIAVLKHSCDFLSEELGGKQREPKDLARIRKACDGLEYLTGRLVEFTGHAKNFDPAYVNLNRCVLGCVEEQQKQVPKSVIFELNLAPKDLLIRVDPFHLKDIILNLLRNAAEAMPTGGVISIHTSGVKDVQLKICDAGGGIALLHQKRIFEPFFSTKPEKSYGGFGLSSVYGLTKLNGAEVSFKSEPGKGAEFLVRFPLSGLMYESLGQVTVLVIDEDDASARAAERVLITAGHNVFSATTDSSLTDILEVFKVVPTLILVRGSLEGRFLARMQTLLGEHPKISIICLAETSGEGSATLSLLPEGDRARLFLKFPYTPDFLLEAVRKITEETECQK